MEQNRNSESRDDSGGRDWREDWDGQDASIPETPWVPDEIDILLHPELAQYRPDPDGENAFAHPEEPSNPEPGFAEAAETASRRTAPSPAHPEEPLSPGEACPEHSRRAASRRTPEPAAHLPAPSDSGFYYRSGKPIPPTHPDHGPMHLIPRQEDGSFAAYYYCSHEELADLPPPGPPPRRHRRDGFDAERQRRFVEHYRDSGSLTDAARLTGISRSTAYNLINSADGAAFRDALAESGKGVDAILEATAFERCINGQEEIVYHQGRRVGVRWKYDNKLLMQMLRARQPLKYAPLSEIEGWLKRRGLEPSGAHGDIDGALDRLAAAEEQWGRRLPGEGGPAPALEALSHTPLLFAENDSAARPLQGEGRKGDTPAIASSSSTSVGEAVHEDPAIASNSSTLPDEPAGEEPAIASNSSTLSDEPAGVDPAIASNSSTLPDQPAGEDPPIASTSSTLPDPPAPPPAAPEPDSGLAFHRPPPRPRLRGA